jgi:hypothetical protein
MQGRVREVRGGEGRAFDYVRNREESALAFVPRLICYFYPALLFLIPLLFDFFFDNGVVA